MAAVPHVQVVLSGLLPSTMYYYRYGNDADGWSDVKSFMSRPQQVCVPMLVAHPPRRCVVPTARRGHRPLQGSTAPVKFIAYADQGVWPAPASVATAEFVADEIALNGFNAFLLHFGDICARTPLAPPPHSLPWPYHVPVPLSLF